MCILNRGTEPETFRFDWQQEPVADQLSGAEALFRARVYRISDLWSGQELGTTRQELEAGVPGHDVLMLRLIKVAIREGQ
jgi:hypothetical protein